MYLPCGQKSLCLRFGYPCELQCLGNSHQNTLSPKTAMIIYNIIIRITKHVHKIFIVWYMYDIPFIGRSFLKSPRRLVDILVKDKMPTVFICSNLRIFLGCETFAVILEKIKSNKWIFHSNNMIFLATPITLMLNL